MDYLNRGYMRIVLKHSVDESMKDCYKIKYSDGVFLGTLKTKTVTRDVTVYFLSTPYLKPI